MRPDARIGTQVAGYTIEALLGRGGMGAVYLAQQSRPRRKVALKLLLGDLSEDENFRQRFTRESDLAASVDHPNILPIYEAGEVDGLLYLAMRYVEGSDLKTILRRDGPMDLSRTVYILGQVASGLDAAHARGLVHRDIKPGNMLVASGTGPEPADHVYLSDFGLTKSTDQLSGLTLSGQFVGTPDYMAPEQIEGHDVDRRVDIYALGCVLFECLTGSPPFRKNVEWAILTAHVREAPPKISERRPGLPVELDAVIATALAKDPEGRYSSSRELIAAARAAEAGAPPVVVSPQDATLVGTLPGADAVTAGAPPPPEPPEGMPKTEILATATGAPEPGDAGPSATVIAEPQPPAEVTPAPIASPPPERPAPPPVPQTVEPRGQPPQGAPPPPPPFPQSGAPPGRGPESGAPRSRLPLIIGGVLVAAAAVGVAAFFVLMRGGLPGSSPSPTATPFAATQAPTPRTDGSTEEAAAAYEAMYDAYFSEVDAFIDLLRRTQPDDLAEARAAWRRYVELDEEFLENLATIDFPDAVQDEAEQVRETFEAMLAVERRLTTAQSLDIYEDLVAEADRAYEAATAAADALAESLGLDPAGGG